MYVIIVDTLSHQLRIHQRSVAAVQHVVALSYFDIGVTLEATMGGCASSMFIFVTTSERDTPAQAIAIGSVTPGQR